MKTFLLVVNILLALTLLAWPFGVLASAFMFDAPGTEKSVITMMLVFSLVFYPAPILLGVIGFFITRKSALTFLPVIFTLIGLLAPSFVLLSSFLLGVVCGGNFACR